MTKHKESQPELKTAQRLKDFIAGCQLDLRTGHRLLLEEPKLNYDIYNILSGFEVSQSTQEEFYGQADVLVRYVAPSGVLCTAEYVRYSAPKQWRLERQTKCLTQEYLGASLAEEKLIESYHQQLSELESLPSGKDILWWPGQERFGHYYSDDEPTNTQDYPMIPSPVMVRAKYDTESEIMRLYCPKHERAELVCSQRVIYPQDRWTFCPVRGQGDFRICSNSFDWRPSWRQK